MNTTLKKIFLTEKLNLTWNKQAIPPLRKHDRKLSLEEAYCQVTTLEQAQKQLASYDDGMVSGIAKQQDYPAIAAAPNKNSRDNVLNIKNKDTTE